MLDPAVEPLSLPVPSPPPIAASQRFGALIEVVLCSGFPTQLFLGQALTAVGIRPLTESGKWSPLFISTLSLIDTILVIGLIVLFLSAHRERARDVFVGPRRVWSEILLGIALMPLILIGAALMMKGLAQLVPQLRNVPENPFGQMLQNRRDALMFGMVAMIAGGVREEIQRGFILHRFKHYLGGGAVGVLVYGVFFGLGHFEQGWDAVVTVAILGSMWGTLYLVRGSIIAPMVSHAGFNLIQVLNVMRLR